MTTDELRATMRELGISQADLAARLGIGSNTMNRMVKGHAPIAGYVVATLELLQEVKTLQEALQALQAAMPVLNSAARAPRVGPARRERAPRRSPV